eukprot:6183486-Alexandrium_andersonii.AAC.1
MLKLATHGQRATHTNIHTHAHSRTVPQSSISLAPWPCTTTPAQRTLVQPMASVRAIEPPVLLDRQ